MLPVVIAVPDRDFDITEVVVPWRTLRDAGLPVVLATERGGDGPAPECDPKLIDDPVLRAMNLVARPANVALYRELERAPERLRPIRWSEVDPERHAGLVLPGGHWRRGMRQYLEGQQLQAAAARFLRSTRPVGAICHGVLVLGRTLDPATGASVVAGRRLTALTASMELTAWRVTRALLGDYYRTYEQTVESELRRAGARFARGPLPNLLYGPTSAGWCVVDGRLVTARWPGDAATFARAFLGLLRA